MTAPTTSFSSAPILDPSADLIDQLVDRVIVLATEAQHRFAETYAGLAWQASIDEEASFWFEREPERAEFTPHFIGTTSGVTNTWLWGWENINEFPEPVIALVTRLRDAVAPYAARIASEGPSDASAGSGAASSATEVTTAELPLEPGIRESRGIVGRPEYSYLYAAMAVSEIAAPVFYRAPTGSGSYAWFVLDNPQEFSLPEPDPASIAASIGAAIDSGLVHDHRLAVESYSARRTGIEATRDATGATVLATSHGALSIEFDRLGRVASMSTTVSRDE